MFTREIWGYVLASLTIITWTLSTVAVQMLGRAVQDFQLSAYRFIALILFSTLLRYIQGIRIQVTTPQWPFVLLMCITNLPYNIFYFAASVNLPVIDLNAGFNVSVLVSLALLNKFLLKKENGWISILSVAVVIVGIVFITQPWMTFDDGFVPMFLKDPKTNTITNNTQNDSSLISVGNKSWIVNGNAIGLIVLGGYGLVALAGIAEAVHFITVGIYLKDMDVSIQTSLLAVFNIPLSALGAFYLEEPMLLTDLWNIFLVAVHCIAMCIGQVASNAASQRIPLLHVTLIQSLAIITFLICQYTLLKDNLGGRMNALEVIGCFVTMAGIMLGPLTAKYENIRRHEDFDDKK